MSNQVATHHVQQYKDNVMLLSQQRMSRLAPTVRTDGDIVGEKVYFDLIGKTAAQKVTTRHADTPLMNTPHTRRAAVLEDYDWADLVDKPDKLKTIYDPTNFYAMAGSSAMGRAKDDIIITALGGTALSGKDGSTGVALPAAQKIVHGGAGLTVAKLTQAKELLDAAEVDEMIERYIVTTAKQITNLLGDTTVTSSDFNTIKALVKGEIDTYMGFKFVRSQRLIHNGTSRLIYAYARTAIGLGLPMDMNVDIGPRRDKRNSTQVYISMSLGAVRIEDEQVIEIACNE